MSARSFIPWIPQRDFLVFVCLICFVLTTFSSTVGKVTNPYFKLSQLGRRHTHAGKDWSVLTVWNKLERSSSLTNSFKFPTKSVVSTILSGKGTISYRSPPIIISAKSASRRFTTPNAGAARILEEGVCGRLSVVKAVARHDNDHKEQNSSKIIQREVREGLQEGGIVKRWNKVLDSSLFYCAGTGRRNKNVKRREFLRLAHQSGHTRATIS